MMLRWRSRALAATLIAFIVLGTSGSGHAADYRLPSLDHDHHGAAAQLCPPSDSATSGQCATCHWLQTFRFAVGAVSLVQHIDSSARRPPMLAEAQIRSTPSLEIPARAPPA